MEILFLEDARVVMEGESERLADEEIGGSANGNQYHPKEREGGKNKHKQKTGANQDFSFRTFLHNTASRNFPVHIYKRAMAKAERKSTIETAAP